MGRDRVRKGLLIVTLTAILLMSASIKSDAHEQTFHFGNTIYKIENKEPTYDYLNQAQINADLRQFKRQTLHDIDVERAEHISTSIKPNHKLNRLATIRAHQIAQHFSHYDKNHRPMTTLDANRVDLPHGFQASENIASAGLGNCTVIGDPKVYHNHNGIEMANMSNDAMMNYDSLENNGHRKNILSSDNTLIGVGVAYSQRKHQFYLAEDFGSRNPRSSADVDKPNLKIHLKLHTG
ncbi:CAP domain-containing protein [uncultured bacterium]|nr:CAP domain-containing protein [uncultured bacterium]